MSLPNKRTKMPGPAYLRSAIAAATLLMMEVESIQAIANDFCNVTPTIKALADMKAELKRCDRGEEVHLQVDSSRVSLASVVVRYCDLKYQIVTDTLPGSKISHVVCKYEWKTEKASTLGN